MYRALRLTLVIALSLGLGLGLRSVPGIGARGSVPLAGPAPHGFPAGTMRVYRTGSDVGRLLPLNRRSLADLSNLVIHTGLRPEGNQNPSVMATSDGSKFAVMEDIHPNNQVTHRQGLVLQLFDARTGAPISSAHHPAVPVWISGISADGSVVSGFTAGMNTNAPCAQSVFYLLDSRTGRLLRRLKIAAGPGDTVLVGPNYKRVYIMTNSDHINSCGPAWSYSPTVTAYDLSTGKVVRSVRLKGIPAGVWETSRTINGDPIGGNWTPGFALSPDGSQIAVLDGHTDTLTLLRAATLRVAATERLAQPKTGLRALAALLGLQTDTAEAKGQWNGAYIQVQYTADGRSLLETGGLLHPDRHHHYASSRSLGVRLIDIAHSQIKAWLDDRKQVLSIWPAPDGSAVYSSIQTWSRKGGWLTTLRYHDPTTLRVRARRLFPHMGNWWLTLLFLQGPSSRK